MKIKELVQKWFQAWDEEDYKSIPVSEDFKHTSPYGTIDGKMAYLELVEANKDKFLNNRIDLHDEIYQQNKACVRYTIVNKDFTMEVSEWLYEANGQIIEIISYYNIEGEINEERKLSGLE